jgi:hypothetical protein
VPRSKASFRTDVHNHRQKWLADLFFWYGANEFRALDAAKAWGLTLTAATYRIRSLRKAKFVTLVEHVRWPIPMAAVYQVVVNLK